MQSPGGLHAVCDTACTGVRETAVQKVMHRSERSQHPFPEHEVPPSTPIAYLSTAVKYTMLGVYCREEHYTTCVL